MKIIRASIIPMLFLALMHPAKALPAEIKLHETHLVPIEKGLSDEWLKSLYQRDEPSVYRGNELNTIGMPVGGIAAGQLYLCGDGTLGLWWIFNRLHYTGEGQTCYQYREPPKPVEQGFAVLVGNDARTLDKKGFSEVEFVGEYPVATVRYSEESFPVTVEMKAFSPFIPLNAHDSALPATIFQITVTNVSKDVVRPMLLGRLENAVCFDSSGRASAVRRTRITHEEDHTLAFCTVEEMPLGKIRPRIVFEDFEGKDYGDWKAEGGAFGKGPAAGTLPKQGAVSGFIGKGLVNTFLDLDAPQGTLTSPEFVVPRSKINFLLGGGNRPGKTCMNLLVDGKVVRTATGINRELLDWHSWDVRALEGRKGRIEIVDKSSGNWGHINIDRIEFTDEMPKGLSLEELPDYGSMALALAGKAYSHKDAEKLRLNIPALRTVKATFAESIVSDVSEKRVVGMMSRAVELAPGEDHTFVVVLAWHFPNHPNGHEYANRFEDAREVTGYVLDNYERLARDTMNWHDTYYGGTLPHWLLERLGSTVSTLASDTCQWWDNGRFWAWEGAWCCHGTCAHVWNYEHAMARLFPELERNVREGQDLGVSFREDGMVGFRGDGVRYAADGQAGTVMKCYREHLMSPDNAFLERNWPNIKRVIEFCIEQDGNENGLIENEQHNTYDINFAGANTFVGSLYLGALHAGEAMATEMGDEMFAKRCARIAGSGSRLSVERLWNGEYFIQDVDLEEHPRSQYADGCLSDQMFGQGWAHQLGLGHIYPEDKVKNTLRSIWAYNWAPDVGTHNALHPPWRTFASPGEAGLFTCTWPKSKHLEGNGVRYSNEVWTGIEYQVAGHMVWEGMVDEGLSICRAIHDRYHPSKRNPYNEVECGDHYARAMASWGVFTALSGYEYHGPKGYLAFAPKISPDDFKSAFTAAEGWGSFSQKRDEKSQTNEIELRWGKLRLRTLALDLPEAIKSPKVIVKLDREILRTSDKFEKHRLVIEFSNDVIMKEGQTLEVTVR